MKIKTEFLLFLLKYVSERTFSSLNHNMQSPIPLPDTVLYCVQQGCGVDRVFIGVDSDSGVGVLMSTPTPTPTPGSTLACLE